MGFCRRELLIFVLEGRELGQIQNCWEGMWVIFLDFTSKNWGFWGFSPRPPPRAPEFVVVTAEFSPFHELHWIISEELPQGDLGCQQGYGWRYDPKSKIISQTLGCNLQCWLRLQYGNTAPSFEEKHMTFQNCGGVSKSLQSLNHTYRTCNNHRLSPASYIYIYIHLLLLVSWAVHPLYPLEP